MTISDETLIAFLDGELTDAEMDQISDALADDEALANRLEALSASDRALKGLFAEADKAPIRADTLALLDAAAKPDANAQAASTTGFTAANDSGRDDAGSVEAGDESDDTVVAFRPRTKAPAPRFGGWMQQAMAASIALFIGLSGGALIFGGGEDEEIEEEETGDPVILAAGRIDTDNPLHALLENGASAQQVSFEGDLRATPLTSFRTRSAGYCREYELRTSETASRNVACRGSEGWTVVASVATEITSAAQEGYITASDETATLIDSMIMSMIEGDILGAEDEKEAMKAGWQ